MKKALLLTVYCLLFTVYYSYAQVPADSLTGTYAGQYWLANPATSPWVITSDTVYISNIDSTNCTELDNSNHFGGNSTYYTDYYSCNSLAPTNDYVKFYGGDSIRFIADNETQPPPNNPLSWRFYGKRINNKIEGVNELNDIKIQVQVYPNPSSGVFVIKNKTLNITNVEIYNMFGESVYQVVTNQAMNEPETIDLSKVDKGVYLLQIKTLQGVIEKKIIIN